MLELYTLHVVVVVVVWKVERQIGKSNYQCALLLPIRRTRNVHLSPCHTVQHHIIYHSRRMQVYKGYASVVSLNLGLYPYLSSHPPMIPSLVYTNTPYSRLFVCFFFTIRFNEKQNSRIWYDMYSAENVKVISVYYCIQ